MYRSLSADRSWTPASIRFSSACSPRERGDIPLCQKGVPANLSNGLSQPQSRFGFYCPGRLHQRTVSNPFSCFVVPGAPKAWKPVNKRKLSTGENGEFGGEAALGGQLYRVRHSTSPRSEESRENHNTC